MSATTAAPSGRKRGPRPKVAQPPRAMTLEDAIAAAKLGEKRTSRLADYRLVAGVYGDVPFAVIHGVAAIDAIASGAGIAIDRREVLDGIVGEVSRMDDELRRLGITPPPRNGLGDPLPTLPNDEELMGGPSLGEAA